jgi:hypothetical protein
MSKAAWRRPTPSEICRAIKAIERSGLPVAQLRIEPDGTIVVGTQPPAPPEGDTDADEWKVVAR